MGRLIAIGDIHGHNKTLQTILAQIDPRPDDEFVFLGDLIDRGPDSRGVIDTVLELQGAYSVNVLMGNHCEMLLAATLSKSDCRFWYQFGGRQAMESYGIRTKPEKLDLSTLPPPHVAFLGRLLDYYETADFIFVHAAYHPDAPMDKQSSINLRWVRLPPDLPPTLFRQACLLRSYPLSDHPGLWACCVLGYWLWYYAGWYAYRYGCVYRRYLASTLRVSGYYDYTGR